MVKLVGHHSCGADRLPVAVRFPAGPRVRLKTVDPPKGNGLGQKKIQPDTEGGTSRTLTGPEGAKGPTEGAGRTRGGRCQEKTSQSEATPNNTSKNAQSNRGRKKQHPPKAKTHPQHHWTPTGKHTNQTTPDKQGQTEQAETKSRPIDIGPNTPPGIRKRTRSTLKRQKANQTTAKKGGQKSIENGMR